MRQRGTLDLFDCWNRLRQSRAAPEHADLDPAAMRQFLPDMFLIEVDPQRHYPLSQVGTRLNAIFAQELKGLSFLSLWQGVQKIEIASLLQVVLDEAHPIVAGATGNPEQEKPCDFEILLLPLRHHGKTHARVLGRLAATSNPKWLGLQPIESLILTSLRVLDAPPAEKGLSFGRSAFKPQVELYAEPLPKFERRGHLWVYSA